MILKNIDFPDLVYDTSRQFMASVFGKPLVVRIHGNFICISL